MFVHSIDEQSEQCDHSQILAQMFTNGLFARLISNLCLPTSDLKGILEALDRTNREGDN